MTFTEFAEKIYPLVGEYWLENNNAPKNAWGAKWENIKSVDDITPDTRLAGDEVCTGGVSGGSCWDTAPSVYRAYINNDASPELNSLDIILEEIAPNITYLQGKKLMREVNASVHTYSLSDYYGNSSSYAKKYVTLEKLYATLVAMGII